MFIIHGCGNAPDQVVGDALSSKKASAENSSGNNSYARGFSIVEKDQGYELTLMDPWNTGDIFASYFILPDGSKIQGASDNSKPVALPIDRWAVSSTTHIGFLEALGEADRVVGCTSPDRIYNQDLIARYQKGDIKKIGSDMEFNFESVLGIEPDIILQTAFEGQKSKDQRFHSTGLDFVYILEWMEPHPLGRAEWIKVFGLLTGKMAEADSIFSKVSEQYKQLKASVAELKERPLVMMGNNFNGTWYMPGGENFMCRFFEDAGYDYPYVSSDYRGSLALNFENVLDEFREADIWLGVSAEGMNDLLEADSRYSLFAPAAKGKVYSVNGRLNDNMGNDYWESGVVFPDLILSDLINIAHPEILPEHKLIYYKRLTGGN